MTVLRLTAKTMPPQKPVMRSQAFSETDGTMENQMDCVDFAFLDSGTGGIPYMLALKEKMPAARCVYLGDTAHFPYGEKSQEEVTRCASDTIRQIVHHWNPKTIVIACNTISVTSLDDLRSLFPQTPIVGTVPAIKLAAKVTRNKRIGLLATNATVRHPYCARLIRDFASDCSVFSRGDPDLIAFIEHELFTATEAQKRDAVAPAVDFFRDAGCDTIVLGCTHFTHIAKEIAEVAGAGVQVVDSREGVANQAIRVETKKQESESAWNANESVEPAALPADKTFFVTACTDCRENSSINQRTEYETLCANLHIPFGGVLS